MRDEFNEARRSYLEQYGDALAANRILRATLFAVSLALVGALVLSIAMFSWAKTQKPIVVRVDDAGRTTPIAGTGAPFAPEPQDLRYFLAEFVQLYFSRIAGSAEDRYSRSLYFLDSKLANAAIEDERRAGSLKQFEHDGSEEIDIEIKNIVLQDLRAKPMKAAVDFEKVFYPRGERRETRRERYAGYFEFVIQDKVPNSFVLVNPLGMTITYFRVDAAFR
jgi:type IV secretory pathway TrbF-like protein